MMKTNIMIMIGLVALTVTMLSGVSMAGSQISAWVIDDFESYDSTAEMKGTFSVQTFQFSGGPWLILQEVMEQLSYVDPVTYEPIPAGVILSIGLVGSPGEPNGFVTAGEIDADGAKAISVSYDYTAASEVDGIDCDLLRLTNTLGIPFGTLNIGMPGDLANVPVADFTKYDKLSLKIKNASNNASIGNVFSLTLIGPDLLEIGYLDATAGDPQRDFFNYPENEWITVEFDISSVPYSGVPSAFGIDMVTGIIIGTSDSNGGKATFYIDEVTLIREGVECGAYSPADINLDCAVDLADLAELSVGWMSL